MTLFSQNSMFKQTSKKVTFGRDKIIVKNGVNELTNLSLCSMGIDYAQYQKMSIIIPPGATDFPLNFASFGIDPTFLVIKPKYCSNNCDLNYLNWKYTQSNEPKMSLTQILMLNTTSANPIGDIVLDNPNPDCKVVLDILVTANDNDGLSDIKSFLFLSGITYDKVETYDQTNSEIFAFYDNANALKGTIDIIEIVSVVRVGDQNRIIIDEASGNNIVLDFVSEFDTLQALSAINWVMQDPTNRALPKPIDSIPPVITIKNTIANNTLNHDLIVDAELTKTDFILSVIDNVIDDVDGIITVDESNITFELNGIEVQRIINPGTYSGLITISDTAGNKNILPISINAQQNIVDVNGPIITFTNNVVGNDINPLSIAAYGGNIEHSDIILFSILQVVDDIDGLIPHNSITVEFIDSALNTVTEITTPDTYSVIFDVSDGAGNITSISKNIIINA